MRFVVLGDGLLGGNAVKDLAAAGHTVRTVTHAELDLLHPVPAHLFDGADVVVNTMAYTNVDWCEEHPKETMRVNGEAAGEVARLARAAGARTVHVSTDYVLDPVSVYARGKVEGERAVLAAEPDALVLRVSTTFGPHPRRKDFVKWVLNTLKEKGEVTVLDDMMSSPTYAIEGARFIREAAERKLTGVFHVANARSASRWEMAVAAQRAFGVPGVVKGSKYADFKGFKAPRARDTRMPVDLPAWFRAMGLDDCMRDYAARERAA